MKKRIFTKSEQETIIKYYRMPYTLTETAHHFKLIRSQVRRILQDNNIPFHSKEDNKLAEKNKTQSTNLSKYGVTNVFQIPNIREKAIKSSKENSNEIHKKMKQTCLKRYGDENYNNSEKMKTTRLKKYGVENFFQNKDILNKAHANCYKKYNTYYYAQTLSYREKNYLTRKQNNSFNISKEEDYIYSLLINLYNKDDIIRQYKSEKYPFHCDFYIKSNKLYIEFNGTWTHGEHPFNKDNPKDMEVLNKWKEKALISSYYKQAIITWTIKDVEKLNIAKKNNLHYLVIYKNLYNQFFDNINKLKEEIEKCLK